MPIANKYAVSEPLSNSDFRKLQIIIFVVALLLFFVATVLAISDEKAGIVSIVYSAAALCLLFTFISYFKKFEVLGLKGELKEVREIQEEHSNDIDLIQHISFAGIVSKYEMRHLKGLLSGNTPYEVTNSWDLQSELKRLDDFGFIYPNEGCGLNTIDEKFGYDKDKYEAKDKTKFNLKEFVHITNYGKKYMELAGKLGLPDRP